VSAQHVDLAQVEEQIMGLCELARAKGWRFTAFSTWNADCGCALQACGAEKGTNWKKAALELGIFPYAFGAGFDKNIRGEMSDCPYSEEELRANYDLGARVARRLMGEVKL